jgi:hypothetical protein
VLQSSLQAAQGQVSKEPHVNSIAGGLAGSALTSYACSWMLEAHRRSRPVCNQCKMLFWKQDEQLSPAARPTLTSGAMQHLRCCCCHFIDIAGYKTQVPTSTPWM